jgi:hypothetical protein
MSPTDEWSLGQARDWTRDRAAAGISCPLCRQEVKVYRRKLDGSMCRSLIAFYRHGDRHQRGWSRYSDTLTQDGIGYHGADYGKLAYWGLLEPDPDRRGYWRVTELGLEFVRREATVPSHAVIYDSRCLRVDGDPVEIVTCLGKKFDYWELMAERPESKEPE